MQGLDISVSVSDFTLFQYIPDAAKAFMLIQIMDIVCKQIVESEINVEVFSPC